MKKLLILIASVVMLTGWRSSNVSSKNERTGLGSPKDVAEEFAQAIIQRNLGKALAFFDSVEESRGNFVLRPKKQMDDLKKKLEDLGHEINAEKLECEVILEDIVVPPEFLGYHLVNGKKYTGETARVLLQFVKGEDKKSGGLEIALMKVNDSWKVSGYKEVSGLETFSDDSDREDKGYAVKDKPVKAEPRDFDKTDRVRAYEAFCREYASLLRKEGKEVSEEDIEKEVERFREYSRSRQEEELENAEKALREKRRSVDAPKKEEAKKDVKPNSRTYDGGYERIRKYERLCQEAASLMKGKGQEISEEDIEKEIEKFKKLSEEKQEAELKEAEKALEYLKEASRAKNADKKAD